MKLNFNLTGFSYDLDEQSNVITIGEDFVKKEEYSLQDTVVPVLQVMVAINKANEMWLLTILIFPVFISVFFVFVYKPLRPRKNVKLHVALAILFLVAFIIWDYYVHKEIIEEISNALNRLQT